MKANCYTSLVFLSVLFLFSMPVLAQNKPGKIIRTAPAGTARTTLDPNADDFVSADITGFPVNDDVTVSEIKYKPIVPYNQEPFGDLRRGPNHGFSDFVPGIDNASYYMFYRNNAGSEALLFRMRLGTVMPGAKGYSVLFDTDGKFGASGPNADPNYIAATTGTGGNPGFEVEIVLTTGGGADGILVYNVDGTDNPTSPITLSGWTNYSQISIAATNDNGDPDFYVDYYVPKSALDAVGITTATSFRVVPTTVMAPKAAIGGPKSDIYGLADNAYKDPNDEYAAYINVQPSFKLTDLSANNTTSPTASICTAPPAINSPINVGGAITISGTWTKSTLAGAAATAVIYLYKNGSTTPVAQTSGAVPSGTWSIPNVIAANGDVFLAKAQATGESQCLSSNAVTASNCNSNTRPAQPTGLCAERKGFGGTNYPAGATISIYRITSAGQVLVGSGVPTGTGNTGFANDGTGGWKYSGGCSAGAGSFGGGTYMVYFTSGGCDSKIAYACVAVNQGGATTTSLAAPVISNAGSIYTKTASISGTNLSGAVVRIYVDDILKGTATGTGTTWTYIFSEALQVGEVIRVEQVTAEPNANTYYCVGSTTATVVCFTAPPTITTESNGMLKEGAAITGVSGEAVGTIIRIYNTSNVLLSTTTVQANGTWSTANAGTTNTNGFTGIAAGGVRYYASAQNGTCGVSANTASMATPTGTTSTARCGAIMTTVPASGGTITLTSGTTSISGTLSGTMVNGTIVSVYQDNLLVGSISTDNNTWLPIDVTNKLYNGGMVMLGIQEPGKAETVCPAAYTVTCTQPNVPVMNFLSCTSCGSPANPSNVTSGGTITYRISNLQANTFYSVREQSTGKSLATGTWTDVVAPTTLDITTTALSGGGTYTAEVVGTFVSSSGVCSAKASQTYKVLPVTVTELKGKHVNNANLLGWKAANETNFKLFVVERSVDSSMFETIGQVNATGAGVYSFTDNKLVGESHYYRLKLVNNNGSFTYSPIVLIKQDNSITVGKVKPNPFVNEVELQLNLTRKELVNLALYDQNGKQVATKQVAANEGNNVVKFSNLHSLAPGIYMLQVTTNDKVLQQKLIKLN
ncbi:MAG: T9SS type A sorting domain-containing protein [Chitinophagaceae bacterium]|nr:MAG: T9SS type A sorting domain-containing protein [Chitinophagaceae bacterium]